MKLTKRDLALTNLANAPLDYELNPAPPKRTRRPGLSEETALQISCVAYYEKRCRVDWALRDKTRLFAVSPNDGRRPMMQRMLAKRMGQRRGPFDLHFMDKRAAFRYVWIECKSSVGTLSQEQRDFDFFLDGTPIKTVLIRTLNEFIEVVG